MLVDAGPLVALIEPTDHHHAACVKALKGMHEPLVTVWPAFTEAMYLVGRSARSQDALWGMLASGGLDFAALSADDGPGMRSLMHRYRDQPMDLADASSTWRAATVSAGSSRSIGAISVSIGSAGACDWRSCRRPRTHQGSVAWGLQRDR